MAVSAIFISGVPNSAKAGDTINVSFTVRNLYPLSVYTFDIVGTASWGTPPDHGYFKFFEMSEPEVFQPNSGRNYEGSFEMPNMDAQVNVWVYRLFGSAWVLDSTKSVPIKCSDTDGIVPPPNPPYSGITLTIPERADEGADVNVHVVVENITNTARKFKTVIFAPYSTTEIKNIIGNFPTAGQTRSYNTSFKMFECPYGQRAYVRVMTLSDYPIEWTVDNSITESIICEPVSPPQKGNLDGWVRDQDDKPVVGAIVKLDSKSTTSTSASYYKFTNLPIGRYAIICSKPGYSEMTDTIDIVEGDNHMNILLYKGQTTCSSCINEEECLLNNCFWYDEACHDTPQAELESRDPLDTFIRFMEGHRPVCPIDSVESTWNSLTENVIEVTPPLKILPPAKE